MTLPTLRTQLNSGAPTGSNDCSVVTLENAVLWASGGKVGPHLGVPNLHPQSQASWARDIRRWAGVSVNRGLLFHDETFRAYQSHELVARFHAAGLSPLRVEYVGGIGWGTLGRRIKAGQFCHLALDYGVLHDGNAPTGSDTFRDGHSLGLVGYHRRHRHFHTWDGDPLFDGRRDDVPKGYQDARLLDFRKAAGAWGRNPPGAGHAVAIFVWRSK